MHFNFYMQIMYILFAAGIYLMFIKKKTNIEKRRRIKDIMRKKYSRTLNLYNDMIVIVERGAGDFDQIPLDGTGQEWIKAVENAVRRLDDNDKE